jgi:hypothetical protein|tara:strand:+ start:343 stop:930 length:588 start_codon:yes stop_codon:yes gene_type:complete
MACTNLTKGRGLDCNRISGGVKFIYFGVYDQFTAPIDGTGIAVTAGEVTDIEMGAGTGLYRYSMPIGVASVTDTIVGSRENGTIYYTPTAQVLFNRLTKEDQNQIKLLGATKVVIFAQLNQQLLSNGHDVIICLGRVNGMELNAGTMDTGAAWGDKNGYTLTFDGMETDPFPMVADYTTNPFDNGAFTNVSITTS